MQVRIEGYDWNRYNGKQKASVPLDYVNWSGAEQYVEDAHIRVCRDRGSFHPDNCSVTKEYKR